MIKNNVLNTLAVFESKILIKIPKRYKMDLTG